MPAIKPPATDSIVLLFILPASRLAALERLLDKLALNHWRTSGLIHCFVVNESDKTNPKRILAKIRSEASRTGLALKLKNLRIQFLDDLDLHAFYELQKQLHIADFASRIAFKKLADDMLEIRLKEWGLHWKQAILHQISKWQHDVLDTHAIDAWLRQFDQISSGEHRWIGEHLLRCFEIWSSDEFAAKIGDLSHFRQSGRAVCILRYENGKSADAISVVLRKKLPHCDEVLEFTTLMQSSLAPDCILIEDGLFTGVEYADLLRSLCGCAGFEKCPPLPDPAALQNRQTILRFAMATDIGLHRLQSTITELNLNISVEVGHEVRVLSSEGLASLHANALYEHDEHGKEVLCDANRHIISQAFDVANWDKYTPDMKAQAKAFCRSIGFELWQSYQNKKGKQWSERRLADCALGAGNMGMLFAFAHSLPKSTLPVFWCHGEVRLSNGKRLSWKPLFASSHQQ